MLILDADGLIKLNRAGVLDLLADSYECSIPSAVYQEALVNAAHRHSDAEVIDAIIRKSISVTIIEEIPHEVPAHIGEGEREVLALFMQSEGTNTIISDDGQFLRILDEHSIPFFSPSSMILNMVDQGVLTKAMGGAAVDLLKPLIKPDEYQRSQSALEER